MSTRAKLIAGTVVVAVLAAGGAAFAAVKLTSPSQTTTAPLVTSPFADGVGNYGLGGGRLGGRGFGGGLGPGHGGGLGFGFRHFFGGGMTAIASYLGVSAAELQSDLQSGQTLAQVAKARGKTLDGLVAAMAAQVTKTLDAAVSSGMLTQAQANQIAARLEAWMKDIATGIRPGRGFGFGLGGGPGGGPGGSGTGSFDSNA